MYFQYAKIQPHLAGIREKLNLPEFLISIQRVVEGSKAGRDRVAMMRKGMAMIADERAEPVKRRA
jgi:hypothetical protein